MPVFYLKKTSIPSGETCTRPREFRSSLSFLPIVLLLIMFFTPPKKVYISMITYCCYLKQYKNNRNLIKSSCNLMTWVYNVGRERGNKMKRAELKAFRISKGFTQKDVAEMLGVSTSHYACIEQGTHNPSTKLVKVFCKVFGNEYASLIIGS